MVPSIFVVGNSEIEVLRAIVAFPPLPPVPIFRFLYAPTSSQVPIEEYKANLEHMVRHVWKAHPEARVLLITPPPIHEVLTVPGFHRYL